MKNLKLFVALLVTFISCHIVHAQTVHGYRGQSINNKGEIKDMHGKKIGKVEKGKVRNAKGVVLGSIAKDGTVTDNKKTVLGKVQPNGNFIATNGNPVIIMDEFGKAKDFKGHVVYKSHLNFLMQSGAIQAFFGGACCKR